MLIIDLTAGAIEIGAIISVFLYGITTVQAYIYFRSSAEDSTKFKLLVLAVWLLESFLTILTCIYLYTITISSYGDAVALNAMSWSMNLIFFVGGLVSAIIQAFFSWRIYVISGHYPVSIISWAGSTFRVAITLTVCILGFKAKTISNYEARWGWTIILSFSVSMAVDLLNASALCYFLWRRPKISPGTHHLIDKVMTWAIETGLATSFCVILILIFNRVKPDWGIWICIGMVYTKVYSNASLLSLNSRSSWRKTVNVNGISLRNTNGMALDFSRSTVQIPRHTSANSRHIMLEMDHPSRYKPTVLYPGLQHCWHDTLR